MLKKTTRVAVLGSGLSGLTTAVELSHGGDEAVTIFSLNELPNSAERVRELRREGHTSAVATAIWHIYLVDPNLDPRVLPWAETTLNVLQGLSKEAGTGVFPARGRELFRVQENVPPAWRSIAPFFRMLDVSEIVSVNSAADSPLHPVTWGYEIETVVAEMDLYLPWLVRQYDGQSVRVEDPMTSLSDVPDEYGVIVNCTGLGAGDLVGDGSLEPVRGQYIIFPRYHDAPSEYVGDDDNSDGMAYAIQRGGGVCIGGTEEHGTTDLTFSESEESLIARASETSPWVREHYDRAVAEGSVERVVGLRPMRSGGVRLEAEELSDGRTVIHNYGHGGSGFSLAWGCARDAVSLVRGIESRK